ncbi:chromosome segregation protein SMC [Alkalihalobacillus alcalophilus ATCC 27647 = CGMCC 1.3604]|uniref:Chromosome segregation protein SMC n=1 Tax=Alkalihalobacillus alcalophilus ATCC 27647 = CGMCC 1.3604 TaxID=1218173 RepID=A0A094WQI1_ALKAL|nr:AAA family ATPase [Alkalihalobacillus alcalophilus]KGA99071.1 chromosome segregation protein SMC [Alkalihalobacillus alcalophilus ATCC 27647 = CGMCC 1.3604]MED1560716.1 AAA family ATPase [Alkalihalobacillus alcalophilus]THG92052.1 chromosome segregation protein SMC [Alkalihalobacillus alcalophilus ATCC 27647 = CGMCC 1.3604]
MIPWRLTFSGIRDYEPTQLDLSGKDDHVMITGPNGAGKSTITFCMGAVLYSSKVDIEGLKSRNLPEQQTWRGKISLLFKNEGAMKIDAPTYIQFSLHIVQEPGQPIKKEFFIYAGEEIDQWETPIKFTSGDRFNNFTAYKKALEQKYKIDPDLFYLIWYQQEVNQFAVMNPEERFRIFSEMHGIDQVQRNWEESMEKLKDTKETLGSAEVNMKHKKQLLSLSKNALDRFLDNKKRLESGAKLYIESLLQLEVHYKKEKEQFEDIIEQTRSEMEEEQDQLAAKENEREQIKLELKERKRENEELAQRIEAEEEKENQLAQTIKENEATISGLEKELAVILEQRQYIRRTEEEVQNELEALNRDQKETTEFFDLVKNRIDEVSGEWQSVVEEITRLKQEIQVDNEAAVIHQERLATYTSSYVVQNSIERLEKELKENRNEHIDIERRLAELSEELKQLEQNRDLSERQIDSLNFFKMKRIQAYPLRELVELDEQAKLKDEHLFDAIKYTIFFEGKSIKPPNDLYHVPLMKLIPDRSVTHLPSLHLKIKSGIGTKEHLAMKALWWIEQLFAQGEVRIENGILVDSLGYRGRQEKDRFILSAKALLARKQVVIQQLKSAQEDKIKLSDRMEHSTKTLQELNSIIHRVKESEAFMTLEEERRLRLEKLAEKTERKELLESEQKELDVKKEKGIHQKIEQENCLNELKKEEQFYQELGQMSDKYEKLHSLRERTASDRNDLDEQKQRNKELEQQEEALDSKIRKLERKGSGIQDKIDSVHDGIRVKEKQLQRRQEDLELNKEQMIKCIQELNEMKGLVSEIYDECTSELTGGHLLTITKLLHNRELGKTKFDRARSEDGIDPAAEANYETIKEEYDRLANEYNRTKLLLEQDTERAQDLKNKLEITINMRVLEIQQRFKMYMNEFQFEGDVSWESYEDRRQRTLFKLYIKARKEGHKGALEDVSVKARGGKVGKGVSGGEESLSSLLFALALLQNLQTTPGFIVLDEFDSALDENRKVKVFDLYVKQLQRKLIILTPKSHESTYHNRFSKAFIVKHDPTIPKSNVVGIVKT